MKNLLSFLLLLLMVTTAYSQVEIVKEYHDNGKLKAEGAYDSNIQATGKWKVYFESGRISSEGTYKNGNVIGIFKFYYDDDDDDGDYSLMNYDTREKEIYTNEKLEAAGKLNDEFKRTGEWKFYNENEFLEEIGNYSNGERTGEWKFYEKSMFLEFNGYLG